jgi:hypothetical protein
VEFTALFVGLSLLPVSCVPAQHTTKLADTSRALSDRPALCKNHDRAGKRLASKPVNAVCNSKADADYADS